MLYIQCFLYIWVVQQAQGFCVRRAEVQNSTVVFQLNISNKFNFCASISRPNAKPRTVVHYGHSTVKVQRVENFLRLTIWLNCAEKILLKFLDFNGLFNYGFEFLTFNWLNSTCWIWLLSLWITNLWLWKTKLKNKTWELKLFFDNWNFNLNIFIN